jgi:Uma2 family endonuclease
MLTDRDRRVSELHDDWPPGIERPPTEDELVLPPGEPMETQRHLLQMRLLMETLEAHWAARDDVFIAGDMFVYFNVLQTKKNDFRGPDFFLVTGTERRERKAWLVWIEGKAPEVVIEVLSETTAHVDRGIKKEQYARLLRVPEYFTYDPFSAELEGWNLDAAHLRYLPLARTESGGFRSAIAELELRVWHGAYAKVEAPWLRWFTLDGVMLPTGEEYVRRADAEAERADAEAERADAAAERADAEALRADAEAHRRAEAEARAAELERLLAELQRPLDPK